MKLEGKLVISRQLAMRVNPSPWRSLKFRVIRGLRLADDSPPEGIDDKDWSTLLNHWDADNSVGLGRGVFYIAGDEIEVERFEAAELLTVAIGYFEPLNEDAISLFMEMEQGGTS